MSLSRRRRQALDRCTRAELVASCVAALDRADRATAQLKWCRQALAEQIRYAKQLARLMHIRWTAPSPEPAPEPEPDQ